MLTPSSERIRNRRSGRGTPDESRVMLSSVRVRPRARLPSASRSVTERSIARLMPSQTTRVKTSTRGSSPGDGACGRRRCSTSDHVQPQTSSRPPGDEHDQAADGQPGSIPASVLDRARRVASAGHRCDAPSGEARPRQSMARWPGIEISVRKPRNAERPTATNQVGQARVIGDAARAARQRARPGEAFDGRRRRAPHDTRRPCRDHEEQHVQHQIADARQSEVGGAVRARRRSRCEIGAQRRRRDGAGASGVRRETHQAKGLAERVITTHTAPCRAQLERRGDTKARRRSRAGAPGAGPPGRAHVSCEGRPSRRRSEPKRRATTDLDPKARRGSPPRQPHERTFSAPSQAPTSGPDDPPRQAPAGGGLSGSSAQ